jgi:methionyl-tRNA synthetase
MFLPGHFIKGACPKCGARHSPAELKTPVSAVSATVPEQRKSDYYFFKLANSEATLKGWTGSGHIQSEVADKLEEWFEAGLQEWNIFYDAPYFGFETPGYPGKYFTCQFQ